jgi:uncharacterized protein
MKFQPDTYAGRNAITRHEPGAVWVNGEKFGHSILVPWQGDVVAWDIAQANELAPPHFELLAARAPELVIYGSGDRLRFLAPAVYRSLIDARIGLETMDTAAACRTYNVLASEGRRVVAALLVGALA